MLLHIMNVRVAVFLNWFVSFTPQRPALLASFTNPPGILPGGTTAPLRDFFSRARVSTKESNAAVAEFFFVFNDCRSLPAEFAVEFAHKLEL